MHPIPPFDVALGMMSNAAIALERSAHKRGVRLSLVFSLERATTIHFPLFAAYQILFDHIFLHRSGSVP